MWFQFILHKENVGAIIRISLFNMKVKGSNPNYYAR